MIAEIVISDFWVDRLETFATFACGAILGVLCGLLIGRNP
jgi:ABC-type nitrate/sulfonate/bicarbonate transport system permease component